MIDSGSYESLVLQASPTDVFNLSEMLQQAPAAIAATGADFSAAMPDAPAPLDLISVETFSQQWGSYHDLAGGMIQMRSGAPCDLGALARNEGGQLAMRAAYEILAANPYSAKMFLGKESTVFGQVVCIGMHGFACVQVARVSISAGMDAANSPQFVSSRG